MIEKQATDFGKIVMFDIKDIEVIEHTAGILHFRSGLKLEVGSTLASQIWEKVYASQFSAPASVSAIKTA